MMEGNSSAVMITLVTCFLMTALRSVTSCQIYDQCVKQLNDLHAVIKKSNGSQQMINPCVDVYNDLACRGQMRKNCPDLLNEWYSLNKLNKDVKSTCTKLCPIISNVKFCSFDINHDALQQSKSDFCQSYMSSYNCSKNLLNDTTCPVGPRLFENFIDSDTHNIGRFICQSGCSNIDKADKALQYCGRYDDTGDVCQNFQSIQSCIQKASLCREAELMMPYYLPAYQSMAVTCSPTTIQTTTKKVLVTSTIETSLNSTILECIGNADISKDKGDWCEIVACLQRSDLSKTDLQGNTIFKELRLKDVWDNCSRIVDSNDAPSTKRTDNEPRSTTQTDIVTTSTRQIDIMIPSTKQIDIVTPSTKRVGITTSAIGYTSTDMMILTLFGKTDRSKTTRDAVTTKSKVSTATQSYLRTTESQNRLTTDKNRQDTNRVINKGQQIDNAGRRLHCNTLLSIYISAVTLLVLLLQRNA